MKYFIYFFTVLLVISCTDDSISENENLNDFSGDSGTFVDERDGHEYEWVKIGEQIWMAENLAYLPDVDLLANRVWEKRYYVYGFDGNDVENAKRSPNYSKYGVLYNRPVALSVCPKGWHLSTDEEWKELEMFIGMPLDEINSMDSYRGRGFGAILKSKNWGIDTYGTDDYGFAALPGGACWDGKYFRNAGSRCYFWSPTYNGEEIIDGYFRSITGLDSDFNRGISGDTENALSIRCIKD